MNYSALIHVDFAEKKTFVQLVGLVKKKFSFSISMKYQLVKHNVLLDTQQMATEILNVLNVQAHVKHVKTLARLETIKDVPAVNLALDYLTMIQVFV